MLAISIQLRFTGLGFLFLIYFRKWRGTPSRRWCEEGDYAGEQEEELSSVTSGTLHSRPPTQVRLCVIMMILLLFMMMIMMTIWWWWWDRGWWLFGLQKKHSRRPSRRVWGRPLTYFSERVSNSDFNPFFNHCCSSYLLSEVPYPSVTWTLSMRHSNPFVYHTCDIQVMKSTWLNRSLQS